MEVLNETLNSSSIPENFSLIEEFHARFYSLDDHLLIGQLLVVVSGSVISAVSIPFLLIYAVSSFRQQITLEHLFVYVIFLALGSAAQAAFGLIHSTNLYFGTWLFGAKLCGWSASLEMLGFYYRSTILFALCLELGGLTPRLGEEWKKSRAVLLSGIGLSLWMAVDSSLYQFKVGLVRSLSTNQVQCLFVLESPLEETYKFLWESVHLGLFIFILVGAALLLALYHILPDSFTGVDDLIPPISMLIISQLAGLSPGNAFAVWTRSNSRSVALVRGWNTVVVVSAYIVSIVEVPVLVVLIHRLRTRKWMLLPNPGGFNSNESPQELIACR